MEPRKEECIYYCIICNFGYMGKKLMSLLFLSKTFEAESKDKAPRRKVNLNSYHRNRNGYYADRNCWAEILCCNYSPLATVLARTVPP